MGVEMGAVVAAEMIAKSTVCMAENQDLGKKVKRVKGEKAVQPEFYQKRRSGVVCNGQEVMTVKTVLQAE
ncbi:unnamed protein product [Bathycoccus prasinos]